MIFTVTVYNSLVRAQCTESLDFLEERGSERSRKKRVSCHFKFTAEAMVCQ